MSLLNTLSKSELFALGEWLSEWPEHWSYQQVIDWLIDNDESHAYTDDDEARVWVWEMVEDYSGTQIASFIANTRKQFERVTEK
jgi:hypothetical protein